MLIETTITERDTCICPELIQALKEDIEAGRIPKSHIWPECVACSTWARGHVLVNGKMYNRLINGDKLFIGEEIPLRRAMTKKEKPKVEMDVPEDPASFVAKRTKSMTKVVLRVHDRVMQKRGA